MILKSSGPTSRLGTAMVVAGVLVALSLVIVVIFTGLRVL